MGRGLKVELGSLCNNLRGPEWDYGRHYLTLTTGWSEVFHQVAEEIVELGMMREMNNQPSIINYV